MACSISGVCIQAGSRSASRRSPSLKNLSQRCSSVAISAVANFSVRRGRCENGSIPPPAPGSIGQDLVQGRGGEDALGPAQQGVGVGGVDALVDGSGQVAKAEA